MRIAASGLALAAALCAATAAAQQYPTKPLRMIVPYPAGGGSDLMARAVSQKLTDKLGQNIVVDNRGGATGMIGTELAVKSPPDGYTLLLGSVAEIALNVAVYRKIGYNPERDLAPVSLIAVSPLVLSAHPSLPVTGVKDFIALAKQRPGKITYGTAGEGSPHHVAGEWMKLLAKIDIVHVPYKGGGPQHVDLLGGHVDTGFVALPIVAPYLKSHRLRALAVTTLKRSPALPDVPTLDESGLKGFDVTQWWGVLVPAGTPQAIVNRLGPDIAGLVALPDMKALMTDMGAEPMAMGPHEFHAYIRAEIAKFRRIVRDASIALH
jgi:tripartite-type tricarboxylate transporter receptor subunit TctC